MRNLIFFLSVIIALPGVAGEVYKWISKEGQTIYSDISQPGAEKVSVPPGKPRRSETEASQGESAQAMDSSSAYQTFEIAQPLPDETIPHAEGEVDVGLSLSPMLVPGHLIHVYLNGTRLQNELTVTQFRINELNQGTHTLQAKVVDAQGKPQIATPTVSFHLRQAVPANP
jgi:hypothetical protein